MKLHLFIIIVIVMGFGTFMAGYSLPPFLEVGFGEGGTPTLDSGTVNEAELTKQFENLYKEVQE